MKKGEAEAFKRLANLVAAGEDTDEKRLAWRLIIRMDPQRRLPKFEIEDAGTEWPESDDLDAALAEAQGRGAEEGKK